jgi:SAM-dependent methyltransferase
LNRLQALGWTTFGIEPAVKSAFPRHHELLEPPGEPTFQLVTLHHVLEHLPDPLNVLQALSRSLADGGILYISVPRLDTLPIHRDLHYCLNPQAHIVSYTRDCLVTLCHMAGLVAVAQPESAALDDLLTQGEPRRLRVFARKPAAGERREEGAAARLPMEPLRQAEAALRAYYGQMFTLPPRLRAARLQSTRRREQLALRWERSLSQWRRSA